VLSNVKSDERRNNRIKETAITLKVQYWQSSGKMEGTGKTKPGNTSSPKVKNETVYVKQQ
jgi:hypothetical protein